MALTEEQFAQFSRDGYILLEDVFSPERVAEMKAEVRRIVEEAREENPEAAENGVHVGLSLASEIFKSANSDPQIVEALVQIIGPNVEFWSDKVVFKSAGTDFGTPWHQDWQYWKGANKFSVWIALDDATPENGCLRMVPGSHKSVIEHGGHGSDPSVDGIGFKHRLSEDAVDESKAVTVPVRAGGAVIFHDWTLHSSLPNSTGKDRWALISTYRNASADDIAKPDRKRAAFMVAGERTGKLVEAIQV